MPIPPAGVHVIQRGAFEAWLIPLGARLMQVWWLEAPEGPRPLCLGFEKPTEYLADRMSMGSVCGRYGNRIADAQLMRAGEPFQLSINHPMGHCIHGGANGFGWREWSVSAQSEQSVLFTLHSTDGDQGFPGACDASILYAWSAAGTLTWTAKASLTRPCPVNLIPHPYWNLDGEATVTGHRVWINADQYLPLDQRELPLPLADVSGTPFDFRKPRTIGHDDIAIMDAALRITDRAERGQRDPLPTVAHCEAGGLRLTVQTDRPFVHIYAAAGMAPQRISGAGTAAAPRPLGVSHAFGAGLCLETEDWPNGPANDREEVWYGPDRAYHHTAQWTFSQLE